LFKKAPNSLEISNLVAADIPECDDEAAAAKVLMSMAGAMGRKPKGAKSPMDHIFAMACGLDEDKEDEEDEEDQLQSSNDENLQEVDNDSMSSCSILTWDRGLMPSRPHSSHQYSKEDLDQIQHSF
jgi:hypothetical protein